MTLEVVFCYLLSTNLTRNFSRIAFVIAKIFFRFEQFVTILIVAFKKITSVVNNFVFTKSCSHFGQILVLFVFDGPAIGSSNAVFCEISPLISSSRLFKLGICGTNCAPSFVLEHVEVLLWRSE